MNERALKDLSEGNALVRLVEEDLRSLAETLYDVGLTRPAARVALAVNRLSKAGRLIDQGTGTALAAHVAAGEQATRNMVLAAIATAGRMPSTDDDKEDKP